MGLDYGAERHHTNEDPHGTRLEFCSIKGPDLKFSMYVQKRNLIQYLKIKTPRNANVKQPAMQHVLTR
jgi:hypothetical protein